ncbi:MAG: helix-turn-helix domain-containing protein [Clostridia bacterium]
MSILGNRIKKERENLNLSREELAKKIGVSYSAIAMYEQGNREPNNEIILKMCEIFDCTMDYLMGNSDIKTLNPETNLDNIKKFYEEKAETLLKNKYINELTNLNLTDSEIKNIIRIITSEEDEITENYVFLLSELFSNLSLKYSKDIIQQVKNLIIKYNEDKINLLTEEVTFYNNKIKKDEEEMRKEHLDKLHPLISGKKSASMDENIEALLNYMDSKNIDEFFNIPVLGKIAAGQPILAEEYLEGYLPVDPNIYRMTTPDDYFYLKVSGESMNLKVHNGDYALIHKQDYAENGDIIVAIINGDDEATLKRYKKINDEIVMLEPMSTLPMEPIVINLKETKFQIIGKAIGQFGKF